MRGFAILTRHSRKLTLIAIALVGVCLWGYTYPQLGISANIGYAWGNALQVAYPEYQILHRGADNTKRDLFEARTVVEIDTHGNAANLGAPRRVATISQGILGAVSFPKLGRSALTPHLEKFKGGVSGSLLKSDDIEKARLVSAHQRMVVLVELSSPMGEDQLPVYFDNGEWKKFFLSGVEPGTGKPIYWWPGWGGCTAMAIRNQNCGTRSVVADFRQWVSQFADGDSENLARLGLDLRRLRVAANEGKIYGFLHVISGRDRLLQLLNKPEIRAVKIVEHISDPMD